MLGGALLVTKRFWDYFGRGHVKAHTGYPVKDVSDYLFFLVPLLLLVALVGLYRHYSTGTGQFGKVSLRMAIIGGALQAIGEFGEAWFYEAMTWGLVGGIGLMLMGISLIFFGVEALMRRTLPHWRALPLILGLLVPLQMAATMLPYHLWGDEVLAAQAGLAVVVLFGLGWMLLGYVIAQAKPLSIR